MRRPRDSDDKDAAGSVVRSEEELRTETIPHEVGRIRVHKVVDTEHVTQVVARATERADVARVVPGPDDSGQIETLPAGSVSIPVFEERLVVQKQLVVIERVIVRKNQLSEDHEIDADLRRERVEIDVDSGIEDRVSGQTSTTKPTDQPR
jgi:uncharacterized protein (TIGR02271 family)